VRRVDGSDELSVSLKAVDDAYPLYGEVRLQPAMPIEAALADRGLAAGAGLLEQLGLEIGDEVRLGEATFTVRARIAHEPDSGGGGFRLGPRVLMAMADLPAAGIVREGSVARFETRLAMPPGTDIGRTVAAIEAIDPERRYRIQSAAADQPQLARLIGRLATFLTLAALAALATGGLGMALAAQSHLEGKLHAIATLRALGGRPAWVGGLYAAQLALLGGLGIALGLLLGASCPTPWFSCPRDCCRSWWTRARRPEHSASPR
jgi:putative ABC transport system permease protein